MAPFEALYGKKCRSPLYWDDMSEMPNIGPDMIREMTEKVKLIQKRMKTAQYQQAKYANIRRRPLCFEKGDMVFLKISPFRGTVRFGKKGKLSPQFIGPYEIFEKIDNFSYRLALPPSLSGIHNPIQILDRKEKQLQTKTNPLVKIQWSQHRVEEATWEAEEDMRQRFPKRFH
ncbi:uncharacterized protein [Henckelia pumila]|uniref:uncharacterized protein n=1 Tax=Henckelia pumila TaxID=405737 RepID=UPI003C6E2B12